MQNNTFRSYVVSHKSQILISIS